MTPIAFVVSCLLSVPPHWAFVAPRRPAPPAVAEGWARNDIDRFIEKRLRDEGLAPSRDAEPETLLRRVTLDLTGLPPTVDEIDAFLADREPGAYERVVDRLLASPRFGERMAVPWLDVARYADSYGYQSDQLSPTWPWRDWVVRAFNENLPYDSFVTWQIAGDLVPDATRESRLATAFNRLHRMTNEGGSIPEEYRAEYAADRVHTFGTAFLGLTLECARCHDHKYDPITHREYYRLFAFFNSIDEYGLYERTDIVPTPSLALPTPEQEQTLSDRRRVALEARRRLDAVPGEREEAFQRWLADMTHGPHAAVIPDRVGIFPLDRVDPGGALANTVEGGSGPGHAGDGPEVVEGRRGGGLRFSGDDGAHLPGVSHLDRWTPFTIAFWLRDDEPTEQPRVVMHRSSGTDVGHYGIDLLLETGHLVGRVVRHWPGNAVAVRTADTVIEPGRWTHVVWRYDGSSAATGLSLFVDGREANVTVTADRLFKTVGQGHNYGPGGHDLVLAQRFRDRGLRGGTIDDVHIVLRAVSDLEAGDLCDGQSLADALSAAEPPLDALRAYYFSAIDEPARDAARALGTARQQVAEAENAVREIMVMEERAVPRAAHVLERGRYDAPKTPDTRVDRGTPAVLPPMPEDAPRDRLGLARWATSRDHPLTARVAVNRFWQILFGRGLVETSENFGVRGSPPTHPALLDWLAVEFMDSGWDVKRLCRTIVLSSAYRAASARDPRRRGHDPDPGNAMLGRGPARRLPAEMIRDLALSASGQLDETMGGPPVSPYQPPGLWREANTMSPAYRQSVGRELYRRSLYTVWKRTAPMPGMVAFDAALREVCTARRPHTSTPIQALVLLNETQFVEAARVLGERMLLEGGETDAARIEFAFRRLTGRRPGPRELAILGDLYGTQRAYFAKEPERAERLRAVGDAAAHDGLGPVEVAAATVVAQAILNLDAAVWTR